MKQLILLCAMLGVSALGASATSIYFDYTGGGFSGSGVFTATDQGGGAYLVTGVAGQQDGISFTGVEPLGSNGGYNFDNLVYLTSAPQLDLAGVLLYWNGGDVNLGYDGGFNGGSYARWNPNESSMQFTASSTPEPGTLLTLGSGLLGLAGLTRKRLPILHCGERFRG